MPPKKLATGLIIDDDPNFHEILVEGISEFDFNSTFGVEDSIHVLNANKFSFILLDYRLGGSENGLALVNHIKNTQPLSIIIMVSAYGTKHVLQEAIEFPIDAYIDKPISLNGLKEKIINLCNKKGLLNTSTISESISHINQTIQDKKQDISQFELKDFAKKNNKNYKYLSQKFKKATGKTFQQLKKEQKYGKIKDLLSNTNLSIKDISNQCGFANPTAIMRGFKLYTGDTMTQFRNKNQKKQC